MEIRARRCRRDAHGVGLVGMFDPGQRVLAAAAVAHVPLQQLAMTLRGVHVDEPDLVEECPYAAPCAIIEQ